MKAGEWVKTLEVVTTPVEFIELTWSVDVEYTRPMPATYTDPPEGGLEICSDAELIGATIYTQQEGWLSFKRRDTHDKFFNTLEKAHPISHDTLWELVKLEVENSLELLTQ